MIGKMIVRVLAVVESQTVARKRVDDPVEDLKEGHKEAEADRRAAAAVLDRASLIVFVRASFMTRPFFSKHQSLAPSLPRRPRG